jgi:hypothetical protein
LHAGGRSGESLTIGKPMSDVTLTYDGNPQAAAVSVAASVGSGSGGPSAHATFDLTGHAPPPPPGTIYALNFGASSGADATITEYEGKAKGNASPVRTLNLDKTLHAVSLAVDTGGNIYVGYFYDSGFQTGGFPDPQNEIAIYAPNASGNDPPTAVLTADTKDSKTETLLFPIFIAFDTSGRLVTYGTVGAYQSVGSVLTYSAGSKGPAAPEDYFSVSSPTIEFPGPSGVAIDSSNDYYLNGTFKQGFSGVGGLYVAPAADIKDHLVTPARNIPWGSTLTKLSSEVTDVALNQSGEIFIANVLDSGSGSGTTCQAAVNVYPAGASGSGQSPLRTMTLEGIKAEGILDCRPGQSPLNFYFPEIQMYGGSTLFVSDPYNDAIDEFASTGHGVVMPSVRIAGSATQLNGPVALAVTSVSGPAKAGPVTGVHSPVRDPFK